MGNDSEPSKPDQEVVFSHKILKPVYLSLNPNYENTSPTSS